MSRLTNLLPLVLATAIFSSAGASAFAQETSDTPDNRTPEQIQEDIEALELRYHETVARQALVKAEQALVAEQLALAAQRRKLQNGGIDPTAVKEVTVSKKQAPPPTFSWPPLPQIKAYGNDPTGRLVSLEYSDGVRINAREGTVIRQGVKVKTIAVSGVLVSLSGHEKWIN